MSSLPKGRGLRGRRSPSDRRHRNVSTARVMLQTGKGPSFLQASSILKHTAGQGERESFYHNPDLSRCGLLQLGCTCYSMAHGFETLTHLCWAMVLHL